MEKYKGWLIVSLIFFVLGIIGFPFGIAAAIILFFVATYHYKNKPKKQDATQ